MDQKLDGGEDGMKGRNPQSQPNRHSIRVQQAEQICRIFLTMFYLNAPRLKGWVGTAQRQAAKKLGFEFLFSNEDIQTVFVGGLTVLTSAITVDVEKLEEHAKSCLLELSSKGRKCRKCSKLNFPRKLRQGCICPADVLQRDEAVCTFCLRLCQMYLFSSIRNLWYEFARHSQPSNMNRTGSPVGASDGEPSVTTIDGVPDWREVEPIVGAVRSEALGSLTPLQRQVFILREVNGFSISEIVRRLKISRREADQAYSQSVEILNRYLRA